MVTLEKLNPFWDREYTVLDYSNEPFNDSHAVDWWLNAGYHDKFTGDMCDMRKPQPSWNDQIIRHFSELGWQDIGTSYYRMATGTVLPEHVDTYERYINLFNLKGKEDTIRRAVVFLEDWKPGHYLEVDEKPILEWSAGDYIIWSKKTPHMAANIGLEYRYTLQITGHQC